MPQLTMHAPYLSHPMIRVPPCPPMLRLCGVFVLCVTLGGCTPSGPDAPSGATASSGIETAPAIPRIAPLAPSITEMVWLVGGRAALAGVTTADDFPPGVESLPKYSALPIDYETIVSLEPDMVVGTLQVNAPRDTGTFDVLDIPVVLLENRSIRDLFASIDTLGVLLGREERAQHVVDSLRNRFQSLETVIGPGSRRPTALFLISSQTSWSFGPESHVHELMEQAGFMSITRDFDTEAPVLSDEFVIQAAPDYIFGTFSDDDPLAALLANHPSWRNVPAVAGGRIYRIDPDLALRPGPRAIQTAWDMAAFHPDYIGE